MTPFVDGHTHSIPSEENVMALVNLPYPEKPDRSRGNILFSSAGIHPKETLNVDFEGLESYLRENRCCAVGECGLDRSIETPLEEQKKMFIRHIRLAGQLRLPLVIHCVRAYYDLIAVKKDFAENGVPWLIHGFRGNAQIAEELQRHGCILSFASEYVSHLNVFPDYVNRDSFLLETDDRKGSIEALYKQIARVGGWDVGELKERLHTTFRHLIRSTPFSTAL